MKLFSDKHRPVHMGPYPIERLKRVDTVDLNAAPTIKPITFQRPEAPESIINAMGEYQAMLDAIRDGLINKAKAEIPTDLKERSNHLKGFGYFSDVSMIGICRLTDEAILDKPIQNPDIKRLANALRTRQTKTLASGTDLIMADLRDSMEAPPTTINGHTYAIVFMYENPRQFLPNEVGIDWLEDAHAHRACLRANETSAVIANYIRLLGYDAKSHSGSASDVDLNKLALCAGLVWADDGELVAPYIGKNFGLGAITTAFELATDRPLAPRADQPWFKTKGPEWWLGRGSSKRAFNCDPFLLPSGLGLSIIFPSALCTK